MRDAQRDLVVLRSLCDRVAGRVLEGPDSGDFLGWHAGTMEYWLHAVVAAEARRLGAWAMRGEVPYITSARVQSAKGEKWSDGAVGWDEEHVGALIEAKAVVAHTASKVSKDIRDKVAPDLAAMLGIDRDATLSRRPGTYEDPEWSGRRAQLQRLYALQFVLVHGVEARACRDLLSDALAQGVTKLVTRYVAQQPTWLSVLQRAYVDEPLFQAEAGEAASSGLLTAWAVPLPWLD